MPELPEVQTTVDGINKFLKGRKITSVWTSYNSKHYKGKKNIKDPPYFKKFKKKVVGEKIKKAERKGKNVLINLSSGKTIAIHMKMTGHLLYGKYKKKEGGWIANQSGPLTDPFNRFIRLIFVLDNGKSLALSDMRRFATVSLAIDNAELNSIARDPFAMSKKEFVEALEKKPERRIMNVLMDQSVVSGIGNIYSDEILWKMGIHPEQKVKDLKKKALDKMWGVARKILKEGIKFGGDSTSDYRNIKGEPGDFQNKHKAYRRTGRKCLKKSCKGKIVRKVVGGRSAHFCDTHQKLR